MDDIYREALRLLVETGQSVDPILDPTSPHSQFGQQPGRTIEVLDCVFRTTGIRSRFLMNKVRAAWPDQAIGMALWTFRATNDLEAVAFYNPNAVHFSDDSRTIRAPWGMRMLAGAANSPFQTAIDLLRRDPSSLRAVVPVFQSEDLGVSSRDVPCLLALQLLIRNGKLNFTCHLRSLNPYWVWPYDHFFLTLLLEFGARLLQCEPGTLAYQVGSLQIDERHLDLARTALAAANTAESEMVPMPLLTNWSTIETVLAAEADLRSQLPNCTDFMKLQARLESVCPDPWWRDLLVTLGRAWIERSRGNARPHPLVLGTSA